MTIVAIHYLLYNIDFPPQCVGLVIIQLALGITHLCTFFFSGVDVTKDCIYLCSNSLGLQPRDAMSEVEREMQKWAKKGPRGYITGDVPWYTMEDFTAEEMAKLVGCKPME